MGTPVNPKLVGTIVSIDVKVGDQVKKNDVLGSMEAMKMNIKIFAPKEGIIQEIHVKPGDHVNLKTPILTLD
ncbi:MAG: Biotin/lipoyl attachment domain-containing protein [Desulfotomaculum sp. 46_296]|nr:MAG: Biotin/lipoyl attachment domain-containing protein [Desulfotomaculum sp. 46_296]HAU30803.1 acetyl-CoA carboxylase biotin carboxyl carrier protein subunit [Desulfotomaculum sp.]